MFFVFLEVSNWLLQSHICVNNNWILFPESKKNKTTTTTKNRPLNKGKSTWIISQTWCVFLRLVCHSKIAILYFPKRLPSRREACYYCLQSGGEFCPVRAKTRRSDCRIPVCSQPILDKNLQSRQIFFETPSILHRLFSDHRTLQMDPNHQDRFCKLHWSFYRICKLVTGPDVVGADVVDADADFVNVDFVDADVGANLVDAEVVCADVVGAGVGADAVRTDVVIGADVFGAEKSNWYRDCAAYFEVGGGLTWGGWWQPHMKMLSFWWLTMHLGRPSVLKLVSLYLSYRTCAT